MATPSSSIAVGTAVEPDTPLLEPTKPHDHDDDAEGSTSNDAPHITTSKLSPAHTIALVVALICCQAVSMVFFKRVSRLMPRGAFWLTEMQAIGCGIGFAALLTLRFVWRRIKASRRQKSPKRQLSDKKSDSSGTSQDIGMGSVHWTAYLLIAGCLAIYNFCMRTGSRGTLVPGPVILLLQQAVVPATLIASYFALRKRYGWTHYVGCLLILGGMALSLVPHFAAIKHGAAGWAVALLLASCIPGTVAFIKVEQEFAAGRMDVLWGWLFVNLFQVLVGLPMALTLPLEESTTLRDIPSDVWGSIQCMFAGINTTSGDDCGFEGGAYAIYWVSNTAMNLAVVCVLKYLGANLSYIAFTAALPVADILFAMPWIVGEGHAAHYTWWSAAALLAVVAGLVMYRFRPEAEAARRK